AIIDLGGGRRRVEDSINYAVGLSEVAAIGESVGPDRPFCVIHAASEADAERAGTTIRAAVTIGDQAAPPAPTVRQRVGPPGA
ncbi:MAG: thymidine phosphorylase, partial [Alphaproteobacteria bacterium]